MHKLFNVCNINLYYVRNQIIMKLMRNNIDHLFKENKKVENKLNNKP